MNKREVTEAVAQKTGLSLKDSANVINAFIETIKDGLGKGEQITLIGFGTFAVRERAARTGHNPRTGEALEIAASKLPSFKAGKPFKESLNK